MIGEIKAGDKYEVYRELNKMICDYSDLFEYEIGDTVVHIQGRPSDVECTNMTVIAGNHSFYVGASKSKLTIYELGTKNFQDYVIDLERITSLEYDEEHISVGFGDKTFLLKFIPS